MLRVFDSRYQHFFNRQAQVGSVLVFGTFVLLGLAGILASGDKTWPTTLVVTGALLMARGAVAASVHVGPEDLVLLGMFRTRSLPWAEIEDVSVGSGATGMNSGQRDFLRLSLIDGSEIEFREFNSSQRVRARSEVASACNAAKRSLHDG